MAIPSYKKLLLPVLKRLGDGQEHRVRDFTPSLISEFSIPEEEVNQVLPSGGTTVLESRIGWARTYLVQAELAKIPTRGYVQITPEGKLLLERNLKEIDSAVLREYPGFLAFIARSSKKQSPQSETAPETLSEMTPEDALRDAYDRIRAVQEHELFTQLKQVPPSFFEKIVVDVIVAMGYGGSVEDAGQAIGKTGDGGIDGVIKQDKLGLDQIFLQAKRWENNVGRPEIQSFVGALHGRHAAKGIFITTSDFTTAARDYANSISSKVILINGSDLVQYMYDHDVGVSAESTLEIKRVNQDYFDLG